MAMNFTTTNPIFSRLHLMAFVLLFSFRAFAQMQVIEADATPFTPTELIENVFLGNGVEITSIQYNGADRAVGYFSDGSNAVGIDRGIIMTTGRVESTFWYPGVDGEGSDFLSHDNQSNVQDANLRALLGTNPDPMSNVAVYIIKFIPTSDTVSFRYCFASEEYPEYACSEYNDVFGFFIQGPGYPAFTNIAKVPGTNQPVAINTIHPANTAYNDWPCPNENIQYYNNNLSSSNQPIFDGFTDVFTAQAAVTPCVEYTIKLAIGDVSDALFDSGVFLEAKSFSSKSLAYEILSESGDATITEGCAAGTLSFFYDNPVEYYTPLDLNFFGSATNGTDLVALPINLGFNAGQNRIDIPLNALEDALDEGVEVLGVDFPKDACTRDTLYITIRENTLLPPTLPGDTTVCQAGLGIFTLDATSATPEPDPMPFSNGNNMAIAPTGTAVLSTLQVVGVQPTILNSNTIESVCINIAHNYVEDLDIFLISPDNDFIELSTDNGGVGDNYTNTCFSPKASTPITAAAAPFSGEFQPEGNWADLYGGTTNGTWQLQVTDDNNTFDGQLLDWTITFAPSYDIFYEWSPAAALSCTDCPTVFATPSQSTDYTVTLRDNYGCEASDTFSIDVIQTLAAPQIDCTSPTTSSVTFDWNDVPGAVSYQINIGNSGWQQLPAGTTDYSVMGLGTWESVNVQIQAVGPGLCDALIADGTCRTCDVPVVQSAVDATSCSNTTDGAVQLSPDGFNPPYSFSLLGNTNTTGVFDSLAKGNYDIVITDQDGCSSTETVTVPSPDTLTALAEVQQNVLCFGGNTGIAQAFGTGGTGQHSFLWNTGETSPTLQNIQTGVYTVEVTDDEGCLATDTVFIAQPQALIAQTSGIDAQCFGTPSGTLQANASGGTAPFDFLWSNGQNGSTVANQLQGDYSVIVTDANGCTTTQNLSIGSLPEIVLSAQTDSTSCHDSTDGSATISPSGGAGNFQFAWSDSQAQTAATAQSLAAGDYVVIVSDANNCTATEDVTIYAPAALDFTFQTENTSCNGLANGTASLLPSGGTAPYAALWSNGGNSFQINGLEANTYTVTLTDAKGCTQTDLVEIQEPLPISIGLDPTPAKCSYSADGAVQTQIVGGTLTNNGAYRYAWNNGQSTSNLNNIPAGIYTLTITDDNGCTNAETVAVSAPLEIQLTADGQDALCFSEANGSGMASAQGGTGDFSFVWENANGFSTQGATPNNLMAGNYQIIATDAQGCTQTSTLTINEPAQLVAQLPSISDTICFGASDGAATVSTSGGTAPYSFLWSLGNQNTASIGILPKGTHTVSITDANGCKTTAQTTIQQKAQLFLTLKSELPRCHDGADGSAEIDAAYYGADPTDWSTMNFLWNTTPPQQNALATGLSAEKTYEVTLTDADGCTAIQEITIGNPIEIQLREDSLGNVSCHGDSDGWAAISSQGGTAPYTYFWGATAQNQTTALAQNLPAGQHRVTITDARGCIKSELVEIVQPAALDLEFDKKDIRCYGEFSGEASVQGSGGTAPFSYLWQTGEMGQTIYDLGNESYAVTMTDAKGCTTVDQIQINAPDPLKGDARGFDAVCYGERNGQIHLDCEGGVPPYRYSLDGENWNGSSVQIGLYAGNYMPRVRDKNGCIMDYDSIKIDQRSQISVDLGPDLTIELGENVQLNALVQNATSPYEIYWSPEDSIWLSCLDCLTPFVDSLQNMNDFEILLIDSTGCSAEDEIRINVEKIRKVFVPTGFTPNGDFQNDVLITHGDPEVKVEWFRIYDRWGELIFEASDFQLTDKTVGWDGTFRGEPLDPGVYVWTLEVEYIDFVKELFRGTTTLIR